MVRLGSITLAIALASTAGCSADLDSTYDVFDLGGVYQPCWCEDGLQCYGIADDVEDVADPMGTICSTPCDRDDDCPSHHQGDAACPWDSKHCALTCDADADCPEGMACWSATCWWPGSPAD